MRDKTTAVAFMSTFSSAGRLRVEPPKPKRLGVYFEAAENRPKCGLTTARAFIREFFVDQARINITGLTYSEATWTSEGWC